MGLFLCCSMMAHKSSERKLARTRRWKRKKTLNVNSLLQPQKAHKLRLMGAQPLDGVKQEQNKIMSKDLAHAISLFSQMNDPAFYEKAEVKTIANMLIDRHVPVMIQNMSWKPFESILDYGCGAGSVSSRFLYPLAEKYSSAITGVDVSPEMIEFAHEKYPHTLATYIVGDIMTEDQFKWPLLNVKFDKILCVHVLHFIQDYKECLIRLCDHLYKHGQLAVGTPYAYFQKIHHVLSEHPKWRKYMSVMKKIRASWVYEDAELFPQSVRTILLSEKMKILDFHQTEECYKYEAVDGLVEFILATNLGSKNVPNELKPELRDDIANLAAEMCGIPRDSKPFPVKINYLRFVAEKQI